MAKASHQQRQRWQSQAGSAHRRSTGTSGRPEEAVRNPVSR